MNNGKYDAADFTGHNSGVAQIPEQTLNNSAARLRSYVERIEILNEDLGAVKTDIKEVYAEAKSDGYDTKAMRKVVSERKKDADRRAEEDAIFNTYWDAL